MTCFLFLLAAPAWADSSDRRSDREARKWADLVVDRIEGYGSAVQEMQQDADRGRHLAESRCLVTKTGELERLAKQADQARERFQAGLKDDSEFAQFSASEELEALLERANVQYEEASTCGMPMVSVNSGTQLGSGVWRLAARASDGARVGGLYFEPGIDLQTGWERNALLAESGPTSSQWFAMTPRFELTGEPRGLRVVLNADTRLSKWTVANERNELGTWDTFGSLDWYSSKVSVSGSAYSQRQAAQLTPWPGLSAPYASASHALVVDLGGTVREGVGVMAWGTLNQKIVQSDDLDRVREGLAVNAELVLGGYEGLVLHGSYENFGWASQDTLALQPMMSGQLYSTQAGLRYFGASEFSALYGVAWLDDGSGPERAWVGRTDLTVPVRGVVLIGFHERTFSDHWLAPNATMQEAGGRFHTRLRGVEVHGSGAWGVERPGDLALRGIELQGGFRVSLPMNTALDLSGGWERRSAIQGTDEALGYSNPKVMLTLEVF